jgi:hypothetical protein
MKIMAENFKILKAEVVSVTEHIGAPYTIQVKVKSLGSQRRDALTIDPRCTFYKDDERPKAIDIVQTGDIIEATYIVHEKVKVAFNIVVMPKPL